MKYLIIEEIPSDRKTKLFDVLEKSNRRFLGVIYYYPTWRKYIFTPAKDTVWSSDCLKDVFKFLEELTK